MSDLDIRVANAADTPAIAEIYRPHVVSGTATFELTPPDAGEIAARIKRVTGEGYQFRRREWRTNCRLRLRRIVPGTPRFRWTVEDSIYVASIIRAAA